MLARSLASAATAAVHKPRSGGSRGPAGPRDMPSASSGGGRRRRREERAAAQPRRVVRPLASPAGATPHRHTHSRAHTHTHACTHSLAHSHALTPAPAGRAPRGARPWGQRGGEGKGGGGESGSAGPGRSESTAGHFPAASPAPLTALRAGDAASAAGATTPLSCSFAHFPPREPGLQL